MSTPVDIAASSDRELVLARILDAPRESVYRAWTEPDLLKRWFAPSPFSTPRVELDVRVGGASLIVMRAPDGSEFPNRGVYLDVVPNARLVFTDAFESAWVPSPTPFMLVDLSFDDQGSKTRYIARVRHWTTADREKHEKMGFHTGWAICADQLETVAASL